MSQPFSYGNSEKSPLSLLVSLDEQKRSTFNMASLRRSFRRRYYIVFALLLVLLLSIQYRHTGSVGVHMGDISDTIEHFKGDKSWQIFNVTGYSNARVPVGTDCNTISYDDQIAANGGFHVEDDLLDIASSTVHPLIDYSGRKSQSFSTIVSETWARMAGASVWLEKHKVFLTVTRVFFYDGGVKHWPRISFLRAQLHDANWRHLENHTIQWEGQDFTFPRMLDVPTPWEVGGGFYGPEDPRIIMEQGVDGAEPVIIFNMMADTKVANRGMFLMRPFSNYTVSLQIQNHEKRGSEKNWSPFFLPQTKAKDGNTYASKYIHFVYEYYPLNIIRCHVLNGQCKFVFRQNIIGEYAEAHKYNDTHGVMRGGTNLERLPYQRRPGLTSFVGIPRTHTDMGCTQVNKEAGYRPEIMIMTTNGTHYWFDYFSTALDFGTILFKEDPTTKVCHDNRILISNSIARIEPRKDLMTVSFSVNDETVQVARIKGVQSLVDMLPQFRAGGWTKTDGQWNLNVTTDVLICSIQSATDYVLSAAKSYYPKEYQAGLEREAKERKEEDERQQLKKEKEIEKEKEKEMEKAKQEEEKKASEEKKGEVEEPKQVPAVGS